MGQSAIDFSIDSGKVVPTEEFAAKVTVLGAAINSGSYDRPVTVEVHVATDNVDPFGAHDQAVDANVNDDNNLRHHVIDSVYDANESITITGRSWKLKSGQNGDQNSEWEIHRDRNSHDESPFVKVLRNGDPVPNIPGFQNQASIEEFVEDYIDYGSNTMLLDENQTIYLFELGTTNLNSSSADFQDLVVLVTLGKSPQELSGLMTAMYD